MTKMEDLSVTRDFVDPLWPLHFPLLHAALLEQHTSSHQLAEQEVEGQELV